MLEGLGWFCFQDLILQLLCRQRTPAWSQSALLKVSEKGTWAHKSANTGVSVHFFLQKTHYEQLLPWDVMFTLLFSCCSQTALGIHLTAGEKQCQISTCSAQDLSAPLIKGSATGAAAIGNHDPFSHPNEVSEAGEAHILFPVWNAQRDSWLL